MGPTYSEDGYTLTALAANGTDQGAFLTFGTTDARYADSQTLYNSNINGVTRLTRDGGGLFNIASIDLATDARFAPAPITFVGTLENATTVQQSFEITGGSLKTFAFLNTFQGLVKLEWTQVTPYHQFDNIVLTEVGPVSVPETGPSLALLAGLWVAGAALRRSGCA